MRMVYACMRLCIALLGLRLFGLSRMWTRMVCWYLVRKVLACCPGVWDSWFSWGRTQALG